MNPIRWMFGRKKAAVAEKTTEASQQMVSQHDPLDLLARAHKPSGAWPKEKPNYIPKTIDDYPIHLPKLRAAMDGAVMDAADSATCIKNVNSGAGIGSAYAMPESLQAWYGMQSFIGYQACALIAQHWLVDKACTQAGEDAIRNGWELKTDGDTLADSELSAIRENDIKFGIKENLSELNRFKNVFGIRVAIFEVESDDEEYYEKPFNIDGVTKGSYKGISQVDPYWMTPLMTAESTSNPASRHFYEPEFWVISGQKYHRSHLIIARGPTPADLLKPTYIFGGISLTQRIYERVYAAERTANEAPLLALSKRTTTLHVDVDKALGNEESFLQKILLWVKYRDNHAVKVLGKDENIEQFDTNLADFDSVIMNQYQLVAAIAKTPSTKLLGTSPKGFDATGEFESKSYHEELESIQEHTMDPMLDRHYALTLRSMGYDVKVSVVWNSVDSISTKERADLNDKKADTDQKNITIGAISPDEVRQRLRDDKHSGYNRLTDDEANETPGMSPENIAEFEKAGGQAEKGTATLAAATGAPASQASRTATALAPEKPGPKDVPVAANAALEQAVKPSAPQAALLEELRVLLSALDDALVVEGKDLSNDTTPGIKRTIEPSVTGRDPSVAGAGSLVEARDESQLQKMKIGGLVICVENPRNSFRVGKNGDWKIKMPHHYGYVKDTKGADGDGVDCFVGRNMNSKKVFVINQVKQDGTFDEHKCMLGFNNQKEAVKGYMASYKKGWTGLGSVVEIDIAKFADWLKNGDNSNPLAASNIVSQTTNAPGEA